jgi:hypothetical protein
LHKSRRELYESMDLDELTVFWPGYYATKFRMESEVERERKRVADSERRRIG